MNINFFKIIVCVFILLGACNKKQDKVNSDEQLEQKIDNLNNFVKISKYSYIDIINSTPSPAYLTPQLEEFNIPYYKNLPLEFDNKMLKYNIQQQAFLQGLFSVDLSYQNFYKKSFVSLSYYNSVKLLAANIGIDKFYNTESLKKFVANKNNSDSLISFTLLDFVKVMNHYEVTEDQDNKTLIITFGAWLESLYLLSEIEHKNDFEFFRKELLMQKVNLNKFINLFEIFPPTYFNQIIIKELNKIKKQIDVLNYQIILKKTETKKINNEFFIIQKHEAVGDLKSLDLYNLNEQIKKSREKIISKF